MILTAENYFSPEAQLEYMGYSQFKDFSECEYMAMQKIKGLYTEPEKDAFLLGSYIDAHFENRLKIFKAQNPGYKRIRSRADKIINYIEQDPFFMKYMSGEKQVIMTGVIAGVPFKIKIDSYHPGKAIVDFKSVADFKPKFKPGEGLLNFIEFWQYDLQGCIYQEIVRQNTGLTLPFIIAAGTKEDVPDKAIIPVPQAQMDAQMEILKLDAPEYHAIKLGQEQPERCERCIPCKLTKKLIRVTTWEELNNFYE